MPDQYQMNNIGIADVHALRVPEWVQVSSSGCVDVMQWSGMMWSGAERSGMEWSVEWKSQW